MNRLGELLQKADSLKQAAEMKGGWSKDPDGYKLYSETLAAADQEHVTMQVEAKHEELREFAHNPNGKAVVPSGFSREAKDGEGVIHPDIHAGSQNGDGVYEAKNAWELWATTALGEEKLQVLKSGAYKDAYVSYLRQASKGPGWESRLAAKGNAMKVLLEGQDDAGGYWVPPDIRADVIKKIATTAVIRPNAFVFTVGSDLVTFPKVVYTADDKYTSGVRFSWTNEAPAANIPEATNPAAGRVQIPIFIATASIVLSRSIIEDGQFDILGYCSQLMGESFALGEEDAFINGNGTTQPTGLLNHPLATTASSSGGMYVPSGLTSTPYVSWGGSAVSTSIDATKGLLGMDAALPPQYERNAKWYFNKNTKAGIRGLIDGQGRPLWATTDSYPNFANAYVAQLLGYPFETAQFFPDYTTSGNYPILLGDMSAYYVADRVGLSVQVFNEIYGLRDEVVLYARKRVGGQLAHYWKTKLLKIASS